MKTLLLFLFPMILIFNFTDLDNNIYEDNITALKPFCTSDCSTTPEVVVLNCANSVDIRTFKCCDNQYPGFSNNFSITNNNTVSFKVIAHFQAFNLDEEVTITVGPGQCQTLSSSSPINGIVDIEVYTLSGAISCVGSYNQNCT